MNPHVPSPCVTGRVSSVPSTPAQPLLLDDGGWEGRMLLTIRRKSPQRELRHTLSQRAARLFEPGAHPGPPFTVPAEAMCVLHLQRCLPRAAKLRFAKSSAEPSLAAAAARVGSAGVGTACLGGDRGTQVGHPGRQQRLSLLKGRSKIWPWVVDATSAALLFGCSPMKWVTNYNKLGWKLGLKHTGFCLVPCCMCP